MRAPILLSERFVAVKGLSSSWPISEKTLIRVWVKQFLPEALRHKIFLIVGYMYCALCRLSSSAEDTLASDAQPVVIFCTTVDIVFLPQGVAAHMFVVQVSIVSGNVALFAPENAGSKTAGARQAAASGLFNTERRADLHPAESVAET